MFESIVSGTLVACQAREYRAFKTREGEQRPAGVTWFAHIVPDFDQAPVAVKVPQSALAEWHTLEAAGFGSYVEVSCSLRAQGNDVVASFGSILALNPTNAEAKASGRKAA